MMEITNEERIKLWADLRDMATQYPGDIGWEADWQRKRLINSAILDLHERMLEMEKRLDEGGGDGK